MWFKLDIAELLAWMAFQPKTSANLQQTECQLLAVVLSLSCILIWVELCSARILELHFT